MVTLDKTGKRRNRRIDDIRCRPVIDLVGGNNTNNCYVFLEDRRGRLIGRRQRNIVRATCAWRGLCKDVDDRHALVLARRLVNKVGEWIIDEAQSLALDLVFKCQACDLDCSVTIVNLIRNNCVERQRTLIDRHIMRATRQRIVNRKPRAVCQSKRAD